MVHPLNENKSSKYYFLANQIKAPYFLSNNDVSNDYKQYPDTLLENLVATPLYNLQKSKKRGFWCLL